MKYYKVLNFIKENGEADYKGLEVSLFKFGSQHIDYDSNLCVVATNETTKINHIELIELTESQYDETKSVIQSIENEEQEDGSSSLENQVQQLMLAVAELGQSTAEKDAEIQMALAEVASMIGGAD